MNEPNKQPFYHRATILLTATRPISEAEFLEAVQTAFSGWVSVIPDSIDLEEYDEPDPGDPADLM